MVFGYIAGPLGSLAKKISKKIGVKIWKTFYLGKKNVKKYQSLSAYHTVENFSQISKEMPELEFYHTYHKYHTYRT